MRGACTAGLLFVFLSGCWFQPSSSPEGKDAAAEAPSGVPAWAPPITPEQEALLAPVDHPIQTPASRVFPDLGRFGYAQNRKLDNLEDAVKFTRMVAKVLDDSPRFYQLSEAAPTAANPVLQYGPPAAEPDGFAVVKRNGEGLGELTAAPGAEEARAALAQGQKLEGSGDLPGAIEAYRAALGAAPTVRRPPVRDGERARQGGPRRRRGGRVPRDHRRRPHLRARAHRARRARRPAQRSPRLCAARSSRASPTTRPPRSRASVSRTNSSAAVGPGEVRRPMAADGGWIDAPPPSAAGARRVAAAASSPSRCSSTSTRWARSTWGRRATRPRRSMAAAALVMRRSRSPAPAGLPAAGGDAVLPLRRGGGRAALEAPRHQRPARPRAAATTTKRRADLTLERPCRASRGRRASPGT